MPADPNDELTEHLHESIPLTALMGMRAVEVGWEGAALTAPLLKNTNHEGTFFGGSLSALALLTGYAVLRHRLRMSGLRYRIVIQRNTYTYERPVVTDVEARAEIDEALWQELLGSLQRRDKGRMTIDVSVRDASDRQVGHLSGMFALLAPLDAGA